MAAYAERSGRSLLMKVVLKQIVVPCLKTIKTYSLNIFIINAIASTGQQGPVPKF
jgi:hypothetical protein